MRIICNYLICVIIAICEIFIIATPVQGREISKGKWKNKDVEYEKGILIIHLKEGCEISDISDYLISKQITMGKKFKRHNSYKMKIIENKDYFSVLDSLNENPFIVSAEPNFANYMHATHPNDPYYSGSAPSPDNYRHQWALYNIGQSPPGGSVDADIDAPEAWDIETGSDSIMIAVLDTGIPLDDNYNLCHEDLDDPNKFILGPNFINGTYHPADGCGHGTHVAGIIGAETNNNMGIAGIVWNAKILVIKVAEDLVGLFFDDNFYDGVIYAVDYADSLGYKLIINFSAGGEYSLVKKNAVDYAHNNGTLQVYAAGNRLSAGVSYPARFAFLNYRVDPPENVWWDEYTSVISVSATTMDDSITSYASYDPDNVYITVAAPGGDSTGVEEEKIFSTMGEDGYEYDNGTSMAAPHVTGVAALIWSRFPNYSPSQIKSLLKVSAEDVNGDGVDKYLGHGRINAYYALAAPATPTGFTVTGSVGQYPILSWSANTEPDIDGYKIYCKIGSGSEYLLTTVNSSTTTYTDNGVTIGVGGKFIPNACYRISAIDWSDLESGKTGYGCKPVGGIQKPVVENELVNLPGKYSLYPVYPNPFNMSTTIRFDLPEESLLLLSIYDMNGNEIWSLQSCEYCKYPAGYHSVIWDGVNNQGSIVSTGIYIINMKTPEYQKTQKVVLIK